jgi:hypothetical protein
MREVPDSLSADYIDGDDDGSGGGEGDPDGDDYEDDYEDEDADYTPAAEGTLFLGSTPQRRRKGRGRDEEEEEGEDLLDNAMKDYQPIAALDTYGREGIDDRDFGEMDVDERREVERVLEERDRERRRYVCLCCCCLHMYAN